MHQALAWPSTRLWSTDNVLTYDSLGLTVVTTAQFSKGLVVGIGCFCVGPGQQVNIGLVTASDVPCTEFETTTLEIGQLLS